VKLDARPHGLANRRNDGFATPRRRVTVAATRGAEPDLERAIAELVAKPGEPRGLVGGADVTTHARPVGGQRPDGSAEQHGHGLVRDLSVQVPERGVDAGQGPTEKRPGELQLRVDHRIVDGVDVADVPTDDETGDEPV